MYEVIHAGEHNAGVGNTRMADLCACSSHPASETPIVRVVYYIQLYTRANQTPFNLIYYAVRYDALYRDDSTSLWWNGNILYKTAVYTCTLCWVQTYTRTYTDICMLCEMCKAFSQVVRWNCERGTRNETEVEIALIYIPYAYKIEIIWRRVKIENGMFGKVVMLNIQMGYILYVYMLVYSRIRIIQV